ncbi:uncharacterized protein TNIN_78812, partial [Trichonephila inaurata madagascariensis]
VKAKFNQYFIFGHTLDCNEWKQDYQNCMQFRKKRDLKCLENVIESENDRKSKRMKAMEQNDVWTYRTSPPENWNSPMPRWMQKEKKNSLLIKTQNMLNEGFYRRPSVFVMDPCIAG